MQTCFDCKYRKIVETSHEWIECHCQKDGRWRNPFRPVVFSDKECQNYEREETENA